jgi:hypothetical protein
VVALLIAERFLEVSDHWRGDDALIATGLIFISLAGRIGCGSATAAGRDHAQRADQHFRILRHG